MCVCMCIYMCAHVHTCEVGEVLELLFLQCVAVCCGVLRCVTVCCGVLRYTLVCCSVYTEAV